MPYDPAVEQASADALIDVIGDSKWEAVSFAKAYLEIMGGAAGAVDRAARIVYDGTSLNLRDSKLAAPTLATDGFLGRLAPRKIMGSAANAITKMFPAAITEERFFELLEKLCADSKNGLTFSDERHVDHSFVDFVLIQGDARLPVNVKNAGTRFENAMDLVGLAPDDCIPIPAYKAYGAVEESPSLIYVVAADYDLLRRLNDTQSN